MYVTLIAKKKPLAQRSDAAAKEWNGGGGRTRFQEDRFSGCIHFHRLRVVLVVKNLSAIVTAISTGYRVIVLAPTNNNGSKGL